MTSRVLALVFAGALAALSLVAPRVVQAQPWQQALANCQTVSSEASSQYGWATSCYNRPPPVGQFDLHVPTDVNPTGTLACGALPVPQPATGCSYDDGGPPVCTQGQSSWPTDAWSDGTLCADGCVTVLTITIDGSTCPTDGSSCNAQSYTENGDLCPYSSSTPPVPPVKPTPPPPPNPPPPPSTCNADGSCQVCDASGQICVTTPPNNTPPPAPPSTSGQGGCAGITCSVTGGGSGGSSPPSGGTAPAPGGTSSPASATSTKCTTGVCDVGDADGNIGGLYQDSSSTPQSMYATYMAQVQSAPIITAASGFFTVQASGACPSWDIPGNEYWGKAGFSFSFFCSSGMQGLFALAGWLVLAGGAFCAFRIAIY